MIPARPSAPGAASEAARAAQRAFFSQALNGVQAPAPTAPSIPPTTPAVRQSAPAVRIAIPDEPPQRPLRPGSLVDIKV